ncbi:MAG: four helix bundle protein [Acidobacteria bacterium]|nr:four helix bundle protein [Acidobacteriota bacterium]
MVETTKVERLEHERLHAYAAAVELDAAVIALTRRAGRGHGWLADQATRASASVVLNLAEGMGREGLDRARTLRIARGSALELDAALTLLLNRGACREAERVAAKRLTVRIVSMLTALRNRAAP